MASKTPGVETVLCERCCKPFLREVRVGHPKRFCSDKCQYAFNADLMTRIWHQERNERAEERETGGEG